MKYRRGFLLYVIRKRGACAGHCVVKNNDDRTVENMLSCDVRKAGCHMKDAEARYKMAIEMYIEKHGKTLELLEVLI